jgi:hypothetical protein
LSRERFLEREGLMLMWRKSRVLLCL